MEKLLPTVEGVQQNEGEESIVAPTRNVKSADVEVLCKLPGRTAAVKDDATKEKLDTEAGDIVAVRQANVFGTSFHPELTGDPRIHVWWLEQVVKAVESS